MDFVVGQGDGFANAMRERAISGRRTGQAGADDVERGVGRAAARGLAADAVDDGEDAALGIAVKPILVDVALVADVGRARGAQLHSRPFHTAHPSAPTSVVSSASSPNLAQSR